MTTAYYTHDDCKRHEMGSWHPECPQRLQAIEDQLIASRIKDLLDCRDAPLASEASLARVHSADAIYRIRENCPSERSEYEHFPLDADTALNAYSWKASLRAAGAAIAATDAVLNAEVENAFCAVRPPGHHATAKESMGFCMFNNVAVAVRHALDVRGLKRIAIVDFDVHHGNGTEDIFRNDAAVLMVGFFQHPYYPYSGTEQPASNMVNIPVPAHSQGQEIRSLVEQHWLPALRAYRPEMIFISAGFDAHREDDMGQLGLVEADYVWITRAVMQIADEFAQGRVVSCLEGGYNLSALGRSVAAHIKVLAGLD
ncbi:histone deacetylase family protein [Undibacterium rugosum]|uniref:histone deacetylase family protein n=1 Tax=Undibacterium rugosum TaxID=2762291 RepID=UPI001B8225AB|nr:histone deacetylase family protein [Undibacterium rugosum]MBR7778491.1 histone deacetylase family protein [Undibacterium rugosum]